MASHKLDSIIFLIISIILIFPWLYNVRHANEAYNNWSDMSGDRKLKKIYKMKKRVELLQ
jgi:ATP/ADP translocase